MNIFFLADARPEVGRGHISRMGAIAGAAVRLGHHVELYDGPDDPSSVARAASGCDWTMLDGYGYDEAWRASFRSRLSRDLKLALLDDVAHDGTAADLIVNPSPGAVDLRARYRAPRVLLGARFAPLRPEFEPPPASRAREGTVVFLSAAPGSGADKLAESLTAFGVAARPAGGLGPVAMREALEAAALGVTAGGVTSIEAARLGLPQLVCTLAENQLNNAAGLAAAGCAVSLGPLSGLAPKKLAEAARALLFDEAARKRMSAAGPALVDGLGARRVARLFAEPSAQARCLRPTRESDRAWLWHLANDPEARRWSFKQEPVSWEAHCAWFDQHLADPEQRGFVLEDSDGEPLCSVRFSRRGGGAVVSVNVAPEQRGRGLGVEALRAASAAAAGAWGKVELDAHVKLDNAASRAAFLKAGYAEGAPCREHENCRVHVKS